MGFKITYRKIIYDSILTGITKDGIAGVIIDIKGKHTFIPNKNITKIQEVSDIWDINANQLLVGDAVTTKGKLGIIVKEGNEYRIKIKENLIRVEPDETYDVKNASNIL